VIERVKERRMGILFDDRGDQGVSRIKASCTDHQHQPITEGQKVNNMLETRAASERFLDLSRFFASPAWRCSPQRIIDPWSMNSRLAFRAKCLPILTRPVSQRTHDLQIKPQSKTNHLCLHHSAHGLTCFDVVSIILASTVKLPLAWKQPPASRADTTEISI
jgi:hypothetical protein